MYDLRCGKWGWWKVMGRESGKRMARRRHWCVDVAEIGDHRRRGEAQCGRGRLDVLCPYYDERRTRRSEAGVVPSLVWLLLFHLLLLLLYLPCGYRPS